MRKRRIKTIGLRIESDLKDALKKMADEDKRSLSAFIRLKLIQHCISSWNSLKKPELLSSLKEPVPVNAEDKWEAQTIKKSNSAKIHGSEFFNPKEDIF